MPQLIPIRTENFQGVINLEKVAFLKNISNKDQKAVVVHFGHEDKITLSCGTNDPALNALFKLMEL